MDQHSIVTKPIYQPAFHSLHFLFSGLMGIVVGLFSNNLNNLAALFFLSKKKKNIERIANAVFCIFMVTKIPFWSSSFLINIISSVIIIVIVILMIIVMTGAVWENVGQCRAACEWTGRGRPLARDPITGGSGGDEDDDHDDDAIFDNQNSIAWLFSCRCMPSISREKERKKSAML